MRKQLYVANLAAPTDYYQPCGHPVLVIGEMTPAHACEAF